MKSDKRIARRLFAMALSLASAFSLSACVDLGKFNADNDYNDYYDAIGGVVGLYDGGSHEYNLKTSLFNAYTIEKLDWENDGDKVEHEEYVYIVIPFEAELIIDEMAMYAHSDSVADLQISVFYFDAPSDFPSNIKYKSSPETQVVTVTENGVEKEKEVEVKYDDPLKEESVADAVCSVSNGWSDFYIQRFYQSGYADECLHVKKDGAVYLRIENNSGFNKDMQSCSLSFINLLIRAV